MKSMKKLVALLLAVVMMLALGTTAFAASSEEDHTGSITITNTEVFDDPEYTAYKIFDVTYADGEDEDGAYEKRHEEYNDITCLLDTAGGFPYSGICCRTDSSRAKCYP